MDLKRHIRDVPDFREPGVRFRDSTPCDRMRRRFSTLWPTSSPAGGRVVAATKLVELAALGGRERLWYYEVFSLIRYE